VAAEAAFTVRRPIPGAGREAEEDRLCRVSRCQSERNLLYYDRAGGAGGTGGNTAGTAGYDRAYSSFIDVSALGGIGGQGGKFYRQNETGGWNWVHVQLGGYQDWRTVNGNATHDTDIRVGQDGALIEYSSSSSSYVSAALVVLNRGVCQCYEQFRRKRGGV
jgi:hypothetical protein